MPSHEEIKNQARVQARSILANSQAFRNMDQSEQMQVYKNVVDAQYQELSQQNSLAGQLGDAGASKQIDDKRHQNERIEQVGKIGSDFIQSVDFPQFVEDLLQAVFDANLNVTIKQMQAYGELMKTATQSLAEFVNKIDNTAAFGYLAENQSDRFSLTFPDEDDKQNKGPSLADKKGNKVDLGDNEIKAKIMDAKLAMAKEQRALLREMLLMGVSRLVVEKGTVRAQVIFDVKATEKIEKKDMAQQNQSKTTGQTHRGGLFSFYSGGRDTTTKESQISISSAKSLSTTDMAAKMEGFVEINFKSDYFKLDNFAQIYGPIKEQSQPATPGTGQNPTPSKT
ncbi:MAG: hypothetical protein U7123_06635 [Potamolinea sp.]